ncbi:MAG: hypothetical protein K2P78_03885 [Gemmataceae bacterium]|nr:hypothetical protein [Gemmataceae bacterium]
MENDGAELTEQRRREVFAALVAAQDAGVGVRASREQVAQQYGIDAETVGEIEDEGLDGGWPPFGKK